MELSRRLLFYRPRSILYFQEMVRVLSLMRRLITVSLIVIFMLWLIPLGIFIAPSEEKLFCDGQRAICMCSHHTTSMGKSNDTGKTIVKASAAPQKESSSSANHYSLTLNDINFKDSRSAAYFLRHKNLYSLFVCKPVEHVPKA